MAATAAAVVAVAVVAAAAVAVVRAAAVVVIAIEAVATKNSTHHYNKSAETVFLRFFDLGTLNVHRLSTCGNQLVTIKINVRPIKMTTVPHASRLKRRPLT